MQRAANGVATDADVREVAYGLAVARGGDSAYEAMYSLYMAVHPATAPLFVLFPQVVRSCLGLCCALCHVIKALHALLTVHALAMNLCGVTHAMPT